jgi:hypothetical protein
MPMAKSKQINLLKGKKEKKRNTVVLVKEIKNEINGKYILDHFG